MTPLRNYVLLTFLSDEEEVTGSGLIIAGSRAVQRARVLECGSDVSAAVKGAHVVVLRKNNTAVQVNGVARNTYLVQETDILAVERTLEEDRADSLLEEIEALRKENATLRCPPPDELFAPMTPEEGQQAKDNDAAVLDSRVPENFTSAQAETDPEDTIEYCFPDNYIPAQAETDPEDTIEY